MYGIRVLLAFLCVMPLVAAPSRAAPQNPPPAVDTTPPVKAGSLLIAGPWIRATLPGSKVAGGFLRITNTGNEPDRFIGGEVSFADRLEIHETSMSGSVAHMRELPDGLEIPPGRTVEFKPGSYHLMFVGLKQPLKQGERVKATLAFEKAGKVEVEFAILPPGAGAPHEMQHDMHMH